MGETEGVIRARCPSYVCRVCRTKTGWPHQRWCTAAAELTPDCRACRYFDAGKDRCAHPTRDKGGAF